MPVGMMDKVGNFVTTMTKPDNMAAIWGEEGLCIVGRTRMAYKRGGRQEARERAIEETMGAITWLYAAKWLNKQGDKVLNYYLKNKSANFDVGSDIMRRPFDNFMMKSSNYPQGFSAKKISLMKGAKVMSALLLANLFIGCVVPKCNQALSRMLKDKDAQKLKKTPEQPIVEGAENKTLSPSFKGMATLNAFTNIIENTNVGKLVGTDIGIVGGRAANARRKEEALDVGIRDVGSMYFYYWARPHVANLMNLAETGGKTAERLDPKAVNCVNKYLEEFLAANGGKMSVEEFRAKMFGTGIVNIPETLEFEKEAASKFENFMVKLGKKPSAKTEAITLDKFLAALTPEQKTQYESIAREMSTLQPKRAGVSVLSKNQIADVMRGGELNSAKFLHKLFDNFTDGLYKQEYKYVSHKSLYKHKDVAITYVEDIIKHAQNGEIDAKLLKSVKGKNLIYNGVNFIVGFGVAVAFLSTLIPKFQYYVTKKVTGKEGFPGSDEFGEKKIEQPSTMNIAA